MANYPLFDKSLRKPTDLIAAEMSSAIDCRKVGVRC
jgi:hypothetical protein